MGTVADGRACRRGKRGVADEPVPRRADDDDGIDRAGAAGTVAAAFRVGGAARGEATAPAPAPSVTPLVPGILRALGRRSFPSLLVLYRSQTPDECSSQPEPARQLPRRDKTTRQPAAAVRQRQEVGTYHGSGTAHGVTKGRRMDELWRFTGPAVERVKAHVGVDTPDDSSVEKEHEVATPTPSNPSPPHSDITTP